MSEEIVVGKKFESFEELSQSIENFQSTNFFQLWVRDSKTIKSFLKRHPSRQIKEGLKYVYLQYCCIHGGKKFESKSTGARPNTRTFKDSCLFSIKMSLTKDGNHLEIVAMVTNHNHACDEVSFKSLPKQRKLDENLEKAASMMLSLGCSKKLLQSHLQSTSGKVVTGKDIFNLEQKLVKNNVLEKVVKREHKAGNISSLNKEKIKSLSQSQKHNKSNIICQKISSLMLECSTRLFNNKLDVLKQICELWAKGQEVSVQSVTHGRDSDGNNDSEDGEELMTRPARYDSGMINEQLAEELVEADPNDSIQTLNLTEINMMERKKRGRPKGAEFTAIGIKKRIKKEKQPPLFHQFPPSHPNSTTNSFHQSNSIKLLPSTTNVLINKLPSTSTINSFHQFNSINPLPNHNLNTTKVLMYKPSSTSTTNSLHQFNSINPPPNSNTTNVLINKLPYTSTINSLHQFNSIKPLPNPITTNVLQSNCPSTPTPLHQFNSINSPPNSNTTKVVINKLPSTSTINSLHQFNSINPPPNYITTKVLINKLPSTSTINSLHQFNSIKPLPTSITANILINNCPPTPTSFHQFNSFNPLPNPNLHTTKVVIIRPPSAYNTNSFPQITSLNHF